MKKKKAFFLGLLLSSISASAHTVYTQFPAFKKSKKSKKQLCHCFVFFYLSLCRHLLVALRNCETVSIKFSKKNNKKKKEEIGRTTDEATNVKK